MAKTTSFEYVEFAPDLQDFKVPWKLGTKTDKDIMRRRYLSLNNHSYGYNRRLTYSARFLT